MTDMEVHGATDVQRDELASSGVIDTIASAASRHGVMISITITPFASDDEETTGGSGE